MYEMKSAQYLNNIYRIINESPKFMGICFINKSGIEQNIDNIYASIPADVQEMRKTNPDNNFSTNLFENLKNFEIILNQGVNFFGLTLLPLNITINHLQQISRDIESICS